jgi:hypothetical protein
MKNDLRSIEMNNYDEGSVEEPSEEKSHSSTSIVGSNGPSGSMNGNGKNDKNNDTNSFRIAEREDVFVVRMKIIVVLSLVLSATALGVVIFYLASSEEIHDFQNQVRNFFFNLSLFVMSLSKLC